MRNKVNYADNRYVFFKNQASDCGYWFPFLIKMLRIMTREETVLIQFLIYIASGPNAIVVEEEDGKQFFMCTERFLLQSEGAWSRTEQNSLMESLTQRGYLKRARKGIPARRWIFIDLDRLREDIKESEVTIVRNGQRKRDKNTRLVKKKLAEKDVDKLSKAEFAEKDVGRLAAEPANCLAAEPANYITTKKEAKRIKHRKKFPPGNFSMHNAPSSRVGESRENKSSSDDTNTNQSNTSKKGMSQTEGSSENDTIVEKEKEGNNGDNLELSSAQNYSSKKKKKRNGFVKNKKGGLKNFNKVRDWTDRLLPVVCRRAKREIIINKYSWYSSFQGMINRVGDIDRIDRVINHYCLTEITDSGGNVLVISHPKQLERCFDWIENLLLREMNPEKPRKGKYREPGCI